MIRAQSAPSTAPTMLAAASLAASTRRRSGVTRNVPTAVWKRNSPAISMIPIRVSMMPPAEALANTARTPSVESSAA